MTITVKKRTDKPAFTGMFDLVEAAKKEERKRRVADPDSPTADSGVFYPSSAGKCNRALAFEFLGEERDPLDTQTIQTFAVGTAVHEFIEKNIETILPDQPDAETEVEMHNVSPPMHGYADLVWYPKGKEVVDWKTSSTYGFMLKLRGAQGPGINEMVQLAIYVVNLDADSGRLVYMLKEKLKRYEQEEVGKDTMVEFVFTRAELQPLYDEEMIRMNRVAEFCVADDEGNTRIDSIPAFIPGAMPTGARIVDPAKSTWQHWSRPDDGTDPVLLDQGEAKFPGCGYCPYSQVCISNYGLD